MRKLFGMLLAAVIMFNAGMLQAQTPQTQPAQKTTTVKKTSTTTTKQHLKADGTPDKRYKENKTTKTTTTTTTGPTKKDGTPDMRYKSNKQTGVPKK
ncbi:hypothetical protein ACTHGU_12620 [Chitinophagaceae bacterium MMS25-I14]